MVYRETFVTSVVSSRESPRFSRYTTPAAVSPVPWLLVDEKCNCITMSYGKNEKDSLLRVFLWDQLFQQDQYCPTKQKEKNVSNLGYETVLLTGMWTISTS